MRLLGDGVRYLHRYGDGDVVLAHVLDVHGALLSVLDVLHMLVQGLTSVTRQSTLGSSSLKSISTETNEDCVDIHMRR